MLHTLGIGLQDYESCELLIFLYTVCYTVYAAYIFAYIKAIYTLLHILHMLKI